MYISFSYNVQVFKISCTNFTINLVDFGFIDNLIGRFIRTIVALINFANRFSTCTYWIITIFLFNRLTIVIINSRIKLHFQGAIFNKPVLK